MICFGYSYWCKAICIKGFHKRNNKRKKTGYSINGKYDGISHTSGVLAVFVIQRAILTKEKF